MVEIRDKDTNAPAPLGRGLGGGGQYYITLQIKLIHFY